MTPSAHGDWKRIKALSAFSGDNPIPPGIRAVIRQQESDRTGARVLEQPEAILRIDGLAEEMAIWVAEQRERPIQERNQGSPGYVADYIRAWRMRFQHRLETLAGELSKNPDLSELETYVRHCSHASDIEGFENAVVTLRSLARTLKDQKGH
jgi:hypothetical protein